jgi:hypothetical protein
VACAQGEAARRCEVVPDPRHTNDARLPAHASAHQKTFLCGNVLENLAKLGLHTVGRQARGVVQQLNEGCALKGRHSEFGKQVLLSDASLEVWRQRFNSIRLAFNYRHPVSIVPELNADVPNMGFEMGPAA